MIELLPHALHLPHAVESVAVTLERKGHEIHVVYGVEVDPAHLRLPAPMKPYRTDDLWQTTCFELFVGDHDHRYREFNFSPSSQWAAYQFEDYRSGVQDLGLDEPPTILFTDEGNGILVIVRLRLRDLQESARIGLSAVIEEVDGHKSYWALVHPDGPPDFHNRDCFVAGLPPVVTL